MLIMAWLNYHLTTETDLEKDKVVEVGLMFNKKFPTKWTDSQLKVLNNVLCNLVKYQNENKIFYYQRAMPNVVARYNPLGLGHKVMVGKKGVLKKLEAVRLIKIITGDNPYLIPAQWYEDGYKTQTSTFKSFGKGTLEFAKLLGITRETIKRANGTHHVMLKKGEGKGFVDYKDSKLSLHVEKTMQDYCNFLNGFEIKLDGDVFDEILLRRNFRDYEGTGIFKYNGRSGGYWHERSPLARKSITINGEPVAQEPLDFTSSIMNILYAWRFKKPLEQVEQYDLENFEGTTYRKLIKQLTVMMLNCRNAQHTYGGFMAWCQKEKPSIHAKIIEDKSFFDVYKVQKLIKQRHYRVSELFYQPLIGRNLEFLEAGLIFGVAYECYKQGIPALTVHDEIIVLEKHRKKAEQIMMNYKLDRKLWRSVF